MYLHCKKTTLEVFTNSLIASFKITCESVQLKSHRHVALYRKKSLFCSGVLGFVLETVKKCELVTGGAEKSILQPNINLWFLLSKMTDDWCLLGDTCPI